MRSYGQFRWSQRNAELEGGLEIIQTLSQGPTREGDFPRCTHELVSQRFREGKGMWTRMLRKALSRQGSPIHPRVAMTHGSTFY